MPESVRMITRKLFALTRRRGFLFHVRMGVVRRDGAFLLTTDHYH
jgi:hypothetical protein